MASQYAIHPAEYAHRSTSGGEVDLHKWLKTRKAVNTVFLPRRIPPNGDPAVDQADCSFGKTNALLAFAKINSHVLPEEVVRMLRKWSSNYSLSGSRTHALLQGLEDGEVFPIHLAAQNAALTLKRHGNYVTVCAYEIQPAAELVVGSSGSLVAQQPQQSLCIPHKHALSETVASQLVSLQKCVFTDAQAKTQRRNTSLTETREVVSSRYVFEWLFGTLSVLHDSSAQCPVVAVTKKVRDRVQFSVRHTNTDVPWRRNPAWLALKFILHATLVSKLGSVHGTLIFKTAMLNFMLQFLAQPEHHGNADLYHQMLAKVSNRLHKLSVFLEDYANTIPKATKEEVSKVMESVWSLVEEHSSTMKTEWMGSVTITEQQRALPDLVNLVEADLRLYLRSSQSKIDATLKTSNTKQIICQGDMPKHADADDIENLLEVVSGREGRLVGLYLFEEAMFTSYLHNDTVWSCAKLYCLLLAYENASSVVYAEEDPVSQSRRLLTSATLICLCDRTATARHPLLLDHQPDIGVEVLDSILACDYQQLQVVHLLQEYIKERQRHATNNGPLESSVSSASLSSRYARSQPAMMSRLQQILDEDAGKEKAHEEHIGRQLEQVAEDEQRLSGMICEDEQVLEWNDYKEEEEWVWRHKSSCKRCALDNDLDGRSADIFERCLTDNRYERQAAVFEVMIPDEVRDWRDSVWFFNDKFLESMSYPKYSQIRKTWINQLGAQPNGRAVTLGSTNVSFLDAHYRTAKLRRATVSNFIKPCNLNCVLTFHNKIMPDIDCNLSKLRKHCTFSVGNASLQPFVLSSSHHQSEVLASQSQCPDFFNLREFVSFGSLRCGERLQWFNLLRGVHERSLLLHRPEVVKLVLQGVWQAGSNTLASILRDAHYPVTDVAFVRECTAELKRVAKSIQGNWELHWTLCAVVLLANRLLNLLTSSGQAPAAAAYSLLGNDLLLLLAQCRGIAVKWLDQVKKLLEAKDCKWPAELQGHAARIATFGALTYQHSVRLNGADSTPLQNWLRFTTDQHINTVLNKAVSNSFSAFLFDQILRVAVEHHDEFRQLLAAPAVPSTCPAELFDFISWFYCEGSGVSNYEVLDHKQLWVVFHWRAAHGQSEYIQIDLRQGQCWINGLPLSRLPTDITGGELYTRLFGNAVLVVKPCTSPQGQQAQLASQSHDGGGGGDFIFSRFAGDGSRQVSIYDIHASTKRNLLLLPSAWFHDEDGYDLPALILEQHSVWIDLATREILFRPVMYHEENFTDLESCHYRLNFNEHRLKVSNGASVNVESDSTLIEGNSQLGSRLVKLFSKLELPQFVELWHYSSGKIVVFLRRHALRFCVEAGDESSTLHSLDHKGWQVDTNQSLGTLTGLQNGIVLVKHGGTDVMQRCLLLPHAPVIIKFDPKSDVHQHVSLNLTNPGHPSLFRYTFNRHLCQVQAPMSRAAWFFLAYLHSVTSSVCPDPFTSLTGTEMAMTILQSARSWSNSPLDSYSTHWLHRLARLSPKRRYYPPHKRCMQTVKWPGSLPSMCASDAFVLLVDQLQSYSKNLSFLFNTVPMADYVDGEELQFETKSSSKSVRDLNRMEYLLHQNAYPIMARLQQTYAPVLGQSKQAFPTSSSPSADMQYMGYLVLHRGGKELKLNAKTIENDLLGGASKEGKAFKAHLDESLMTSCGTWQQVMLQTAFFNVQTYIETKRTVDLDRLHLGLLFSFWRYTSCQDAGLLDLAIALANTDVKVSLPGLRSFPASSYAFPTVISYMSGDYIQKCPVYAKKHGLQSVSRCADKATVNRHTELKRELEEQYKTRKLSVRKAITMDVEWANRTLASAPYDYANQPPVVPERSFESFSWPDREIIIKDSYHNRFEGDVARVNASKILTHYAKDLHSAIENVPVCTAEGLYFGDFEVLTDPAEVRGCYGSTLTVDLSSSSDTVDMESSIDTLRLCGQTCTPARDSGVSATAQKSQPCPELRQLDDFLSQRSDAISADFADDLERSTEALLHDKSDVVGSDSQVVSQDDCADLKLSLQQLKRIRKNVSKFLVSAVSYKISHKALQACGLLCRSSPLYLFPELLRQRSVTVGLVQIAFTTTSKEVIGSLAVAMVKAQRWARIVRYHDDEQLDWWRRECRHVPHTAWSPMKHIDWLLFQVENDLSIWETQVHVAERMMQPLNNQHAVMQLNMGEGKTSVILPIIAAELADGEALVRVVVLTSLFATNSQQLVFKLGGLLNHRVCSLPFHRDVKLTEPNARLLVQFLDNSRQRGDVMVTVREHMLSLLLRYQDACCRQEEEESSLATILGEGTDNLNAHDKSSVADILGVVTENLKLYARDVIDEADEVLHHRFQLVYPIGHPCPPDGGEGRIRMAEVVLEAVKEEAPNFAERFRTCVEYQKQDDHAFPQLRILESAKHENAYKWLCEKVVDFIFSGRGRILKSEVMDGLKKVSPACKKELASFLLSPELSSADVDWFNANIPGSIIPAMLTLRGLLANGVLLLALKKRFRVEYGLPGASSTSTGSSKKTKTDGGTRTIRMAVPFRAKDVAAERTEFGHTDVAIVLTLLSYYQQGLTNQQVNTLLDRLERKEARTDIYASWVNCAAQVNDSIRELSGINRQDVSQMRNVVIPFLRHHQCAINFYLNHVIFPSESKEFKHKLVANAWSMVSDHRPPQCRVTGFSGTNDTRHLLPGSVCQQDLPALLHTNAHVCKLVLSPNNNMYNELPTQCSSLQLIELIVRLSGREVINTVIDAGAFVLDLTNKEFALAWLAQRPDKRAVVYFDGGNELCVLDRQTWLSCKLALSAFAGNLAECLVYLDHAHCRGTDLPMAQRTRAAVTLGKGLRRDELMQACMRMRRLGLKDGHTLSFWSPPEVHRLIVEKFNLNPGDQIQHLHVLQWCFLNSIEATEQGFYSWATQGLIYCQSEHALFGDKLQATTAAERGQSFVLPDCMPLVEMYGQARELTAVPEIIRQQTASMGAAAEALVQRCEKFVPYTRRHAQRLDEEQEREMEQEKEEQRQLQLPPKIEHVPETMPEYLANLPSTGVYWQLRAGDCSAVPLWECLKTTNLWVKFEKILCCSGWNGSYLKATESFANVVKTGQYHGLVQQDTDKFLRPVHWILRVRNRRDESSFLLLVSPFEANELALQLRRQQGCWSLSVSMVMYSSMARLQQGIMADWSCCVVGDRIPRLRSCPDQLCAMFTEILLFSGGLFFGEEHDDKMSAMESLAKLLFLDPGPSSTIQSQQPALSSSGGTQTSALVAYSTAMDLKGKFPEDPVPFLRALMAMLRSEDSLELSDMGSLLLRHSWVQPKPPPIPSATAAVPAAATALGQPDRMQDNPPSYRQINVARAERVGVRGRGGRRGQGKKKRT